MKSRKVLLVKGTSCALKDMICGLYSLISELHCFHKKMKKVYTIRVENVFIVNVPSDQGQKMM